MFPSALGLGLLLCSMLVQAADGECEGESPTKRLLCHVDRLPDQFDPCLCTHLVLQAPIDKLSPQSELVASALRLRERNPSLRVVARESGAAEEVLRGRAGRARAVAAAVAKCRLDGVEVALRWPDAGAAAAPAAAKLHVVDFVKLLSKEFEKLEPKGRSKREYKIYEEIAGDVVTPRWTPPSLRSSKLRKTRDVEGEEKDKKVEDETTKATKETTSEDKEDDESKESKEESEQEIEEPEAVDSGKQIFLRLTSQPQALAKNFDLKRLSKYVSLFTLSTENMTDPSEAGRAYHPARLMGIEDILNADSLVDLVTGLGAPHEKLVLTLPAAATRFAIADRQKNLPRSPVVGSPRTLTRPEMCKLMSEGEWTVERDEDLTAPYAFHGADWLAFDDPTSASIKGKYVLLRDLGGAAVEGAEAEDWAGACGEGGPRLLRALHDAFTRVARKSRAAQLASLQEQLHEANQFAYSGDVHLSPYRIVRVVDREGDIHVVRKEAKTEFECSRQGYFRHPSGCNRFYRCVKFNQYSPEYTVFEYDCPAGLAFDETVEVCVWPGSLADGGACQGSSEIAPVPRNRFICPAVAGYYADPENCRWFFACLDHQGDGSPLTAYEFRCPFGLVFDEQKLVCDWPWLVPGCGGAGLYTARFTVGDFYEGRHRPSYASLSDVHVSGGRIENVPGGVVLGSALSGIGAGAYQGTYASGSNVGSGVYSGAGGAALGYGAGGLAGSYQSASAGSAGAGSAYPGNTGSAYNGGSANGAGAGSAYGAGAGSAYGAGAGSAYGAGAGSAYSAGAGSAYGAGAGSAYGAGAGSAYSAGAGSAYGAGAGSAYGVGAGLAYSAGAGSAYGVGAGSAYGAGAGSAYSAGAGSAVKSEYGQVYSGPIGSAYSGAGGAGSAYLTGAGGGVKYGGGATSTRYGSAGTYGSYGGGAYVTGAGAYVDDNSGAYVDDNSGAYFHDGTGDFGGLYSGQESYGGQYKGSYVGGGAYVPGVNDNGAYKGSYSSGGQYKGSYEGGGAYSGSYDKGIYSGSGSDGGQYKGEYDAGSYTGKYDSGVYTGKNDGGAYSGKYDGDAYSGKYDSGAYSGKYDGGEYSGQYDGGAYSGKYGGKYSGKYDGGAYSGASDSGDYHGGTYFSGEGYQAGYKAGSVPAIVDGAYGVHEFNKVDVLHRPAVGLVGLDAVKVSGGDVHSGGYVGSYVTPSLLPAVSVTPVAPVVSSYSTVTPAPAVYSTVQPTSPRPVSYYPSSTVTPISSTSKPLVSYSTVKPPAYVQTYQQPSYVSTVTPIPSYSYSTPSIGVVNTPVVPLSPVTYTYKKPVVSTGYVSTYTPSPISSVSYQPTPVKAVTPVPYYEKGSFEYTYQRPIPPAYIPPSPSYSYEYNPHVATYVKPVDVKYSYPKPAVLKTPIVPLNPIQYSTPAPVEYNVPVNPIYNKPASISYVSYPTPAPPPIFKTPYVPTVYKAPVVPLNPVQYTTPAPVHFEYSTPSPISTYSRPIPPVRYQPAAPARPTVYSTPAPPVSYEYSTPRPVVPVQPIRPITYSTPAPIAVDYHSVPTVLKTPVVPLSPVQYTTPAPIQFEYSTPAPLRPVSFVKPYSTPAPVVSYEYSPPAPIAPVKPLRPVVYSAPEPIGYDYPKPIVPFVEKSAVVPLNPIQYTPPAPQVVRYEAQVPVQPVSYVKPVVSTYSTPAPPPAHSAVVTTYSTPAPPTYSTLTPFKPAVYSTPAPPAVYNYEYTAPAVRPVVPAVYKTPVVPLNPIQYSTPAPVHFEYSTLSPVPLRPVPYATPAPDVHLEYLPPAPVQPVKPLKPIIYSNPPPAVYQYQAPVLPVRPLRPVTYTTPAPVINYEYTAPVVRPVVPAVLKTPVVPLNPIQYTTPAPIHFEYSTPAPLKPIYYSTPAPAVNYQYLPPAPIQPVKPLRPIVYSNPAPPSISYETSVPVARPVIPEVLRTPVVPLNPVQYTTPAPVYFEHYSPAPVPVKPLKPVVYTTPAPVVDISYVPQAPIQPVRPLKPVVYSTPAQPVSYEYRPPSTVQPVKPIYLSSPAPFSYGYKYQPVQSVPAVLKAPVVPLNPIQYTTPAPLPVIQYTTAAPVAPVSYVKPLKPVTYTTPAPAVSYEFSTPVTPAYVRPVPTVLKNPVVPLNPVQYSTPAPVVNRYSFGVPYQQQPEIQYEPEFYKQSGYKKTEYNEGYAYHKPAVNFVETPKIVSTTPTPTVTYSYETPEPVTPVYKQAYNYIKAPMVSTYEKVLNAITYSTTPAPAPLPVQPVTQSPVSYAPANVGLSYNRPILVKTPSIPVTPVSVVPEYQKVLNVVKATTTPAPVYVNHYTSSYEPEIVPVSTPRPVIYRKKPYYSTESAVKDYAYEENVDEVYDVVKSDFGTRLNGFEEGHVYNQHVDLPQVVYTSTTPAPVPVVQETYRVRKPIKTYLPAVAVGYKDVPEYILSEGPAVVSSEATFGAGEQYHKESSFTGYTGHSGDSVTYEEVAQAVPVVPAVTSSTQGTTLKVSRPEGGYYVRKQKVRVRPVVVTTENYPTEYTPTYTPSTISTTTFAPTYSYSTTMRPAVVTSTTIHPDDVVDVEGEEAEEEVKILEEFNGQYGGIVNKGGYSGSSTVASIEDGEAIVGVLKKGKITYDGRRTKSKVVVVSKLSDFNPLLVGKLGAECSCDGRSNNLRVRARGKQRGQLFTPSGGSTVPDQQLVDSYLTSTSTAAPLAASSEASYESSYESASYDKVVEIKPLRKKVRYYSTTTTGAPTFTEEVDEPEGPNLVAAGVDRVKADTVVCNRAGLFRHPKKCNKFYSCDWDQWKKKFTLNEFKCPIHLAYDSNLGACNWPSKGPACSDDNLLV